jgi:hypothetical protein
MVTKPELGSSGWGTVLNAALDDVQAQLDAKFSASGGTISGDVTITGTNVTVDSAGTAINAVDRQTITNFAAYVLRTGGADRWSLQMVNDSTNDLFLSNTADGTIVLLAEARATMSNLSLLTSTKSYGGGVGVVFIPNRNTAPTTNPSGGAIFYAEGGVPKFRAASGDITNLTKQTVTGSRGGNAALASLLTALATMGLITDSTTA